MKKNIILSMVGVAAAGLLLSSCSGKPEEVTAVVAGPHGQPAAVVVKYAKAVSAESVTADAFVVPGQEIESVFVTDKDITAAPEKPGCNSGKTECDSTKACPEGKTECDSTKACPEGKAQDCCAGEKASCSEGKTECPESKTDCKGPKSVDGQYVVIVFKKACAGEKAACSEGKAECSEGKTECGNAGKAQDCCAGEKAACPEAKASCPEGKAECNKEGKTECGNAGKACKEIAVPQVSVEQVKDIKAVDGSVIKAWNGKAFNATKAVPCFGPKAHKHHHGAACPEKQ